MTASPIRAPAIALICEQCPVTMRRAGPYCSYDEFRIAAGHSSTGDDGSRRALAAGRVCLRAQPRRSRCWRPIGRALDVRKSAAHGGPPSPTRCAQRMGTRGIRPRAGEPGAGHRSPLAARLGAGLSSEPVGRVGNRVDGRRRRSGQGVTTTIGVVIGMKNATRAIAPERRHTARATPCRAFSLRTPLARQLELAGERGLLTQARSLNLRSPHAPHPACPRPNPWSGVSR